MACVQYIKEQGTLTNQTNVYALHSITDHNQEDWNSRRVLDCFSRTWPPPQTEILQIQILLHKTMETIWDKGTVRTPS